jgi:hypothetical protein
MNGHEANLTGHTNPKLTKHQFLTPDGIRNLENNIIYKLIMSRRLLESANPHSRSQ